MTNEIKEIINNLIEYRNSDYKCKQPEDCLTIEDVWLLLDYITNLQEENERLKKQYAKEEMKLFHDNEILQQRIDKAINYILENICCDTRVYTKNENVYKVIDILRGDKHE